MRPIPTEIQLNIAGHLSFPDLCRMRGTCQAFRTTLDSDTMKPVLGKLERDNAESQHWSVLGTGPDRITAPESLVRYGYSLSDAAKLFELVPCYTCLSVYPFEEFEFLSGGGGLQQQVRSLIIPTRGFSDYSNEFLAGDEGTRKCITCVLETEDRPTVKKRWITCFRGGVVLCKNCGYKVWHESTVPGRQKATCLCRDCFEEENKDWLEYKEKIQELSKEMWKVAKFRFGGDAEAEAVAVDDYLYWMRRIDEGSYKMWETPENTSDWFVWPVWKRLARLEGVDVKEMEWFKTYGDGGVKEGEEVAKIMECPEVVRKGRERLVLLYLRDCVAKYDARRTLISGAWEWCGVFLEGGGLVRRKARGALIQATRLSRYLSDLQMKYMSNMRAAELS